MSLTEAQKLAFGEWMTTTLTANKETIKEAKPNIPFPVGQYAKTLGDKRDELNKTEGELARLMQEKRRQTKIANGRTERLLQRSE